LVGQIPGSAICPDDDFAWAERNQRWLARTKKRTSYRKPRERSREPLILTGHGVSLRIDRGTLLIQNGFTHYPQERETYRYFNGDLNLPPKIIMLDGSGGLSFDVISWLAAQNVALFRIDYLGEVASIIGGSGAAYDPARVQWQVETRTDPERRLEFCCELIADKIAVTIETMKTALPESTARSKALEKAARSIARLKLRAVGTVNEILLVEAGAAATYFAAWRGLPLRWRQASRFPFPPTWRFAETRASTREGKGAINRHATHPLNAMLNYAYAILHSQVQMEAINEGYDPRLGIMHETRTDGQAFVLDLMERRRPSVDAAVLKFVAAEAFSGADFVIQNDGVCRLAPQLARRVAQIAAAVVAKPWVSYS
jgi:CRISPR-associated protein Cas1